MLSSDYKNEFLAPTRSTVSSRLSRSLKKMIRCSSRTIEVLMTSSSRFDLLVSVLMMPF